MRNFSNLITKCQEAELNVKAFVWLRTGFWREISVLSAPLKNYQISDDGNLVYNGRNIGEYVRELVDSFAQKESEPIKKSAVIKPSINKTIRKMEPVERKPRWKEPEFDETPEEKMARKIRENEEWLAEQDAKNRRRKGL